MKATPDHVSAIDREHQREFASGTWPARQRRGSATHARWQVHSAKVPRRLMNGRRRVAPGRLPDAGSRHPCMRATPTPAMPCRRSVPPKPCYGTARESDFEGHRSGYAAAIARRGRECLSDSHVEGRLSVEVRPSAIVIVKLACPSRGFG